jgi:hypothetical protein
LLRGLKTKDLFLSSVLFTAPYSSIFLSTKHKACTILFSEKTTGLE